MPKQGLSNLLAQGSDKAVMSLLEENDDLQMTIDHVSESFKTFVTTDYFEDLDIGEKRSFLFDFTIVVKLLNQINVNVKINQTKLPYHN